MSIEDVNVSNRLDLGEIGYTGLNIYSGVLTEEKLRRLDGDRGKLTYMEMRDNDDTIGAIDFVIDKIVRQVDWRVEPFSKQPDDVAKAEFLRSCMTDMDSPWDEFISEVMTMQTFGFAPMEMVFKRRNGFRGFQLNKPAEKRIPSSRFDDGLIGWRRLPLRAQETITRWKVSDHGDIEGMIQQAPPLFNEVFIPINKTLLFRTSVHKNNPEGRSSYRNAFRPWYFKSKIENLEGIGVERDLAGLPVAFVPPEILNGKDDRSNRIREKLKEIVTNIRIDEQGGILFPMARDNNGNLMYDLKLMSSPGSKQFKTNEIIQRYSRAIATTRVADFILLGHEKVGSFSLASSKTEMFSLAVEAWLTMIKNILNRKAIPFLWLVNGFDQSKMPKFEFGDIESVNLDELGNYINALTNAGVDLSAMEVQNYLKSQASIPLETTEE